MRDASHFQKDVSTVALRVSVEEIAEQMRREGLGCVVVVDDQRRPVGIVTDRDLALRVVARGLRAKGTSAQSVMSHPLATARPTDAIEAVIECMCRRGIRRVPIVHDEQVMGIVTLDDLLVHLGRELEGLGSAVRRQFRDARGGAGPEVLFEEICEMLAPLDHPLARASARRD